MARISVAPELRTWTRECVGLHVPAPPNPEGVETLLCRGRMWCLPVQEEADEHPGRHPRR